MAGLMGLAVLVGGWILGISFMRSIIPGAANMRVNTALSLMITASAILLDGCRRRALTRLVPVCATALILISLATLTEHVTGRNLGVDELLFADREPSVAAPGRMAAVAAVNFLLLGIAILLRNRSAGLPWSQFFFVGAAALCFANLLGYLYGIRNFDGIEFYNSMAVHASLSLLMLALSNLLARPDRGLMVPAISENLGGVLIRRLLPAAVGVPVFLGWLGWQGELKGLYSGAFGVALFATSNVVVFAYLIWTAGWRLNGIDAEKAHATALLRARENLLSTFVKRVPAAVAMFDRDMRYLQVSDRWCTDYRLDSSELLGRSHYEMFRDIPERWKMTHQRCLAGETLQQEDDRWERASGESIWLRWETRPWGERDGLPEGILIFAEDITEQKRQEQELRKFVSLADNSDEFIGMCDMNLMPFYANQAALRLVGLNSLEQLFRTPVPEFFFPEDQRFITEEFFPRVLREGRAEVEIRFRHFKTGKPLWMICNVFYIKDAGGEVVGLATVSRDISERKHSEERLRESEERFRNMADTAPVLIWTSGPDRLCTFFNKVWLEFTGRTLEQELGNGWAEGVHPDDLNRCLAIYSSSFDARRKFQMEYRLRRADGMYRWLLHSGVPRLTAGGIFEGYIGSCVDVTDFKQAQERFRLVVEASPAAMVMMDSKGKIVLVNSRTEKLFGYGRQELMGQSVEILVPESFRESPQSPRNNFFLQGKTRPMGTVGDSYGRRKDGSQFPVEIGLDPIETEEGSCVLASIVDVTERKLAQEKLRESEKRFRATFYQAAVGIAQTTIDGHWLLVNDRLCEILGFSQEELRGKTFIDLTHPDDREASLAAVRKLISGEIPSWSSAEKRYIRKDGVTVWSKVFVSLVRDQHNVAQYFIKVVEDITEKLEALRALQESRQELRALAGRLINAQEEERRRISRQLHDDFSQRLAVLALDVSGLALAPPPSPDHMKETFSDIHTRIGQMSADIRRISHQLHPSILEDLGLAAALREMCEELLAREGIEGTLEQETMPESLPKEAASCLYWIAREALHNVSKYAHASHVRVSLSGSPEGVQMCIHDDGAGFDPEVGRGHGLGIVSMKERAIMVQGDLSIRSQPGQGTEVRVFIPLPKTAAPITAVLNWQADLKK
jgi:PAS domain S-box-containing protein